MGVADIKIKLKAFKKKIIPTPNPESDGVIWSSWYTNYRVVHMYIHLYCTGNKLSVQNLCTELIIKAELSFLMRYYSPYVYSNCSCISLLSKAIYQFWK